MSVARNASLFQTPSRPTCPPHHGIVCATCGYRGPHAQGPGAGPHHKKLVCGLCERFLKWLPKPPAPSTPPTPDYDEPTSAAACLALATEIQACVIARDFDVALSAEQYEQMRYLYREQGKADAQAKMDASMRAMLGERQEELIEALHTQGYSPALDQEWEKFTAAHHAFARRQAETVRMVDMLLRCQFRFLRSVLIAIERGDA